MSGLSDLDVIETLEKYGFTSQARSPWRGDDPEQWDAYPIEIDELPDFGRNDAPPSQYNDANFDPRRGWDSLSERINAQSGRPERLPPPDPVEAMAWYLPFHYYGPEWGIYIKEAEIVNVASFIKMRLGGGPSDWLETQQLCRVALSILYLHESFHHKVESFATRLEISRMSSVYLPYDERVFQRLLHTDEVLEEAIACYEMHSRLSKEKSFHGNVPSNIKSAALSFLHEWIPTLPPGYRRGLERRLLDQLHPLMSQVAQGVVSPSQDPDDWKIANHMIRGLFDKKQVAHVVVPVGDTPCIPWLDAGRYLALSPKDVERHITRDFGYYDTGMGKGSHRVYKCPGRKAINLKFNRPSLPPHIQRQVAEALGYKNILELAEHC